MLCVSGLKLLSPFGVARTKSDSQEQRKLGRNLARLRTEAGLTQEQLSEKAGISTRYVQDLEAGLYAPTIFVAEALRKALNCAWSDLLRGC